MVGRLSLSLVVLTLIPMATSACPGPSLAVTSLRVQDVSRTKYLMLYRIIGVVRNVGQQAQSSDALQFVDIKQYGQRLDDRGVPPLRPGESHSVSYVWRRAVDAGQGTTPLEFRLRGVSSDGGVDCNVTRAAAMIWF